MSADEKPDERLRCVCCSLPPSCFESFGECGHPFCYVCVGRGHDEDCVECEEEELRADVS